MFASLDWLPTFVEIAGGPKGDELKKQIEAGKYPGIVKTTLDGFNQLDYLEGKSDKSARDIFFYYLGPTPSAVRYKNWKLYYTMGLERRLGPAAGHLSTGPWSRTSCAIRSSRPSGSSQKTRAWRWRRARGPHGLYYDWNMLPIGQLLWEKELMSYKEFPPLQAPETYNLDGILKAINRRPPERLTVASNRRAPHHSAPAFREWRRLKPAADPQAIIGQTAVFDANASVGKMLDRGHHAPVLVKAMAHRSRFVERPIAAHGIMAGRNIAPGLAVVDRLAERAFDEDILIELKSPSEAGIKVAGLAVEIDRAAEMGARDQYVPHLSGENIQLCEQGFGVEIDRAFLGTERVMRISAEPKLVRKEVGA